MTASFPRLLLTAAVSASLLLGVAACGKKGSPRAPEGEASQYGYPHAYPAPSTVVPNGGTTGSESGPTSIFRNDNRSTTTTY